MFANSHPRKYHFVVRGVAVFFIASCVGSLNSAGRHAADFAPFCPELFLKSDPNPSPCEGDVVIQCFGANQQFLILRIPFVFKTTKLFT